MQAKIFCAIAVTLTALSSAKSALALPEFPEKLQEATNAPCIPQCNICHRDDNGGGGTIDKPFVKSLREYGELEHDMKGAVDALAQAGVDSDGDGTPDVTEIKNGDDPNSSLDAKLCFPDGGCGARVEPAGTLDGYAGAAALFTALVLGRSFRRKSRRR